MMRVPGAFEKGYILAVLSVCTTLVPAGQRSRDLVFVILHSLLKYRNYIYLYGERTLQNVQTVMIPRSRFHRSTHTPCRMSIYQRHASARIHFSVGRPLGFLFLHLLFSTMPALIFGALMPLRVRRRDVSLPSIREVENLYLRLVLYHARRCTRRTCRSPHSLSVHCPCLC